MNNLWKELEKADVKNKEKYVIAFRKLINQIQKKEFDFKNKETEDYYIINEKDFVYIVPKELFNLFMKMRRKDLNEFLGFTVLISDTRVSCFGIPCSELSKAIIN
jgi:hypothetical protein